MITITNLKINITANRRSTRAQKQIYFEKLKELLAKYRPIQSLRFPIFDFYLTSLSIY